MEFIGVYRCISVSADIKKTLSVVPWPTASARRSITKDSRSITKKITLLGLHGDIG